MLYYLFDLDETLIIHHTDSKLMYNVYPNKLLKRLLKKMIGEKYIYTNATYGHADILLNKLDIHNQFKKIYARDTIPYMKPDIKSLLFVKNNILYSDYNIDERNTFVFFEDTLENLYTAKKNGWITVWIHPYFYEKNNYNFVDYSFPNIYDALFKMQNIRFY